MNKKISLTRSSPLIRKTPLKRSSSAGLAPRSPKRVSPKLAARRALFATQKDKFLKQHPECRVKWAGCTFFAIEVHHAEGREGILLNEETKFVEICRNCHDAISLKNNRSRAIEEGFIISRLKKK